MSKKHYVVWQGVKPGIYDNWPQAKAQIDGRSDAQYMGFPTKAEAESAYQSTYTKALMKRSLEKSGSTSSASPANKTASGTYKKTTSTGSKKSSASKIKITPNEHHTDISIYCDGACSPNPGKSGTGIAVYQKAELIQLYYGLYEANGTNNTAELNGILKAFKLAEPLIKQNKTVAIYSDSKYSIDCITKWAKGWQSKGWKRGKGEEIKNLETIKQCFALYELLKNKIEIIHVKGHADIEGNELSDRMAVLARRKQEANFVQYQESLDIKLILAMESG